MTGPKFPTPASGVRPSTSSGVIRSRADDEDTPVGSPALARIGERTKAITTSQDDIARRVGGLEGHVSEARVQLGSLATQVVSLDTKVDILVEESKESRRERQDRERAAEKRATDELAFRRERWMKFLTIVVPLVAAIGTVIAGLAGAFR